METVNDSNTTVFGCMNKIQHALENHDVFESNYQYLMNSPMVKKLKRLNEKLRKQNNEYKIIIKELTSKLDNTSKKKRVYEEVKIKIEPIVHLKTEPKKLNTAQKEVVDDDDVIILENNTKPNIVYEIIDELDEETSEAIEEVETEAVEADEEEVETESVEADKEEVETEAVEADEEEDAVEADEEEAVEADKEEEAVEEDDEVFETTIQGKKYYTTNETDGVIYSITDDNDIGDKVGVFKNKIPEFLEECPAGIRDIQAIDVEASNMEEIETEEEVFEITINKTKYYTSDETNGVIYSIVDDGEIGDEVGNFVKGVAVMKR
jgi:hypothetical protein